MNMQIRHLMIASTVFLIVPLAFGWSNGGPSFDRSNPNYGTHDWIDEHALEILLFCLQDESAVQWLDANRNDFLLGSEAPDFATAASVFGLSEEESGDYGDTATGHHIYWNYDRSEVCSGHDGAAERAQEEAEKALVELANCRFQRAAFFLGAMTHYLADVAVFAHVIGEDACYRVVLSSEEYPCHSDYEQWVQENTDESTENYFAVSFDGHLQPRDPYTAALEISRITDGGNIYQTDPDLLGDTQDCIWMLTHCSEYTNRTFHLSVTDSLNRAINMIAEVILYVVDTAERSCPKLEIETNRDVYRGGDRFEALSRISNPGIVQNVDYYVLLEAGGQYFFYPQWQCELDYVTKTVQPGTSISDILVIPALPSPLAAGGPFIFHGGLFEFTTLNLISYDNARFYFE